jgi:hypothetical protein
MIKKIMLSASAIGTAALAFSPLAHAADGTVTVPSDFGSGMLANAGSQLSDPGTLAVLAIVGGLIVAFWIAHKLIGFAPKSK